MRERVGLKSPVRENCTPGSVRGASGNRRPYRDGCSPTLKREVWMTTELWRLGAADLAQAIREKQVSSREVVQAHLERIEAVNSRVNAITVVLRQEALQAAEAADKAVS